MQYDMMLSIVRWSESQYVGATDNMKSTWDYVFAYTQMRLFLEKKSNKLLDDARDNVSRIEFLFILPYNALIPYPSPSQRDDPTIQRNTKPSMLGLNWRYKCLSPV